MTITQIEIETKNLLIQHLRQSKKSILLGTDAEGPSRFSCLLVGDISIGIIQSQFTRVKIYYSEDVSTCFLGYDNNVSVVSLATGTAQTYNLDGVFFTFLPMAKRQMLLSIHELGILAFFEYGTVAWNYISPDIIVGWDSKGEFININSMDNQHTMLNIRTGRIG